MGETEKNNPEKNVIYKYDALIRMNIWEQQGSKTRSPHYSKKTLKHYGANTNNKTFPWASEREERAAQNTPRTQGRRRVKWYKTNKGTHHFLYSVVKLRHNTQGFLCCYAGAGCMQSMKTSQSQYFYPFTSIKLMVVCLASPIEIHATIIFPRENKKISW